MKSVINYQLAIIIFLLIGGLFSGCGFQLRATVVKIDIQKIYLRSESATQITREIKRILIEQGVKIVQKKEEAQVVLYLRNENVNRRVLSVSSSSGKLEEVEINYQVEMEVRKPDNTVLIGKLLLSLSRDYRFNELTVLAAGAEEEILRQDMFHDIVTQIMRRLQTIRGCFGKK